MAGINYLINVTLSAQRLFQDQYKQNVVTRVTYVGVHINFFPQGSLMAPSERNILGCAGRTHTLVTPRRLRDCKFARQPSRRTRHTPATSLTSLRGVVTSGTPNTMVHGHQACDSFHIYFYFHFIYSDSKLAIFARTSPCLFTLSVRLLTCFVLSFPS